MVWECTHDPNRVLKIREKKETIPTLSGAQFGQSQHISGTSLLQQSPSLSRNQGPSLSLQSSATHLKLSIDDSIPPILHVNREFRAAGLSRYQLCYLPQFSLRHNVPPFPFYFNPDKDTIELMGTTVSKIWDFVALNTDYQPAIDFSLFAPQQDGFWDKVRHLSLVAGVKEHAEQIFPTGCSLQHMGVVAGFQNLRSLTMVYRYSTNGVEEAFNPAPTVEKVWSVGKRKCYRYTFEWWWKQWKTDRKGKDLDVVYSVECTGQT